MFRFYGLLGLICILLAYFLSYFNPVDKALNNFLLGIGIWLFFDSIDFKLNKTSLLHKIKSKNKIILYIIFIGILTGLFVEFFGAFVSNLWWEPHYPDLSGMPLIEAVFISLYKIFRAISVTYLILLPEIYSVYRVLNHFFEKIKLKGEIIKSRDEKNIFHYLGFTGLIFIIIPLPLVVFLDLSSLIRGFLFAFPLLGLWFLLEYIEHSQHKRSLLLDLLKLKEGKLIAIFLTSILIGLLVEKMNLFAPAWSYKNLPFSEFTFLGIPIVVLLGWIPLIIIFLSFYRVFIKENDHLF